MTWLTGYTYRKKITITGRTGASTNYQVKLQIGNASGGDFNLSGHAQIFPNDVRFTSNDGSTQLSYWIENVAAIPITVWTKVTASLEANADIYCYYGKAGATSESNYFSVFDILGNGNSGSLTVTSANTVVNIYTYLTGNQSSDNSIITVNSGTGFSNGDEILIIQTQNFTGDTSGSYEFRKILSGGGTTTFTLDTPLKNSYVSGVFSVYVEGCAGQQNANVTQVVRVPQYMSVTINNGANITATAWNGYSGGIVAFKTNGTVTIASGGSINVTSAGFRCGPGCCVAIGYINGCQGEDYRGTGTYTQSAKTTGGGGAGKLCDNGKTAGGGGGSYATAGANGYIEGICTPGIGCTTTFGSPDLNVLFFGGAAGVGYAGPAGNSSGGIIFIGADTLNNSGTIKSGGSTPGGTISPSGGGAGGSIFITARTLTTGNSITALGGSGGLGGGAGGNGRIRLSANSITGTSNPGAYTTGFDTEHNRKYTSPEPTFSISGTEEVPAGSIKITSYPSGAGIWLAPHGQTPVWQNEPYGIYTPDPVTNLAPGFYDIRLTRNGYEDWIHYNIEIISNTETQIYASLVLIATPANITATSITLDSISSPCVVGNCTMTISAIWTNTGETSGSFVPSLTIDGTPMIIDPPLDPVTVIPSGTVSQQFIITGIDAGTYTICPDPN
jgi:Domain of unknown function (DUF2341)